MKTATLAAALLLAIPGAATALPADGLAPAVRSSTVPAIAQGEIRLRSVQEKRARLAATLDELAGAIELRKAEQRGRLLPDPSLQALLRRSQALAQELARVHRDEEEARAALELALQQRLPAIEAELAAARGHGAMQLQLEAERAAIRRQLERPAAASFGLATHPGDDPDELREQADLLRDQRDRIVAQRVELESRLQEARQEELLAKELRHFLEEGDLFDDGERMMRASRTITRSGSADRGGDRTEAGAPPQGAPSLPGGNLGNDAGVPQLPPDPVATPDRTTTSRIYAMRPMGKADPMGRRFPALAGDETAEELLVGLRQLEEMADELERLAAALELRAMELAGPRR